jgi:glucose uptake protein GlcU
MWGIAQCGLMSATQILGYTVGFPIGSAGPILVSSLWSVIYFREIRGTRNLLILTVTFALLLTGMILLALSKDANLFKKN